MGSIFTKDNLKTSGCVVLGALLAQRFTAGKSALVTGVAAFAGGLAGLILSKKF
jgi:hypothetical protein